MPGRYSQHPAGGSNGLWESFNIWPAEYFWAWIYSQLMVKGCCAHLQVPTSSRSIVIYLAETKNFLVGRQSSMLVATIIFWTGDSILSGWETFSTTDRRMQFFLGNFQHSGWRIDIYIAQTGSFLIKSLRSIEETVIFWLDDSMLPCLEEIFNFRSENAIPLWTVSTFRQENCDQLSRIWGVSTQKT